MTLTWKKDPEAERSAEFGYLGKWQCFSVFKDRHLPRSDNRRWGVSCNLPGMPYDMGRFLSPDDAKAEAQNQANLWMEGVR